MRIVQRLLVAAYTWCRPSEARYCVNEPENKETGKAMFPTLMGMMWKRKRQAAESLASCSL